MCGIAGWVSFDDDLNAHRDVISKMTETMALRGPDAGGVWIDRHVGLGHRRLAIIDLAGGVQPMQVEDDDGADDRLAHLHRRGLQLRGVARPAQPARSPVQEPERHRSRAARIPAMGRRGRRTAQRHVRLRDLGRSQRRAVPGSRSHGREAAVLLSHAPMACCSAPSRKRSLRIRAWNRA